MYIDSIRPINNNHLVRLEGRNEHRLIHLAGKREITGTRTGKCLRSDRFETHDVLVSQGGAPINSSGSLRLLSTRAFIRVSGVLQEPYVHIEPIELVRSELIITPEIYNYSGWYRILDIFKAEHGLTIGTEVFPLYGTPRIEMEDDTEYITIEGIGVMKC